VAHTRHGAARPARRGFDLLGAVTVTAGMLLLVYAVVSAPQAGWASPRTLVSFATAIALLGAFLAVERRSRDPLVRLGIFRSGALTRANLAIMVLFGSYVSFQFLVTQYLQIMAGWSALGTALAFLPAGVLVAVSSPRMGSVLDRFGPARVAAAGFASLTAGYTLFLRVGPAPDYPAVILPSLLLIGAAFGLGFAALNILATAGVADHEQGLASGLLQTSMQVGGAIVLAVVTAVIDARGADHAISAGTLAAYRPALAVITGVAVVGLGVTLTGLRSPRPGPALAAPDPDADEAELEPVSS
jgi:predicted MFS family arabinose efflux permease